MEKQTLQPSIGLSQAVALYIGAVLGSGVLLVPGLAADIAGPSSLLAWGFMGLLALPMASSMGLLAAKYPNAGGVSHFVTIAFGKQAGTLIGWFFLMSVPIGAPVAAITGAGYLSTAMGWGEGIKLLIAAGILLTGLLTNLVGMKLAGKIQVAVVTAILAVLLLSIVGSIPHIKTDAFSPFMPHGWVSVGQAAAILFWSFIGWEAVSHLSEEFLDPEREAVHGVTIAAVIVGVMYFLVALAVVGTHSYENGKSASSLALVVEQMLGPSSALLVGITAVFICTATIISYIGAASRLAYALAKNGSAPKPFVAISKRFGTPIGGISFLSLSFLVVMVLYGAGSVSLTSLIQFPNATFILTYVGGSAAGIRLLKDHTWGRSASWISFLTTISVFPFTGWAILYPIILILGLWLSGILTNKKSPSLSNPRA